MKHLILIFFLLPVLPALAQEDQTPIRVNPLHENMDLLEKRVLRFKDFQNGKVVFKDSVVTEARLNYHRLFDQILFLNSKGDTLALTKPETIAFIVIASDTFYYHNKGFVEKLSHFNQYNLMVKRSIKYIGKEKKGAYGSYSTTTSVNSVSDLNLNEVEFTRLYKADENSIYVINDQYFLSDKFNNIFPASKKNFFNLFSRHQKSLEAYIKEKQVDFNKGKDLEQLMGYLQILEL